MLGKLVKLVYVLNLKVYAKSHFEYYCKIGPVLHYFEVPSHSLCMIATYNVPLISIAHLTRGQWMARARQGGFESEVAIAR
jgi:hypothetical protein